MPYQSVHKEINTFREGQKGEIKAQVRAQPPTPAYFPCLSGAWGNPAAIISTPHSALN